jgi:hypothetical protein
LNGESVIPLNTVRPAQKVISRGGSLGEATADSTKLWAWAVRHLERLVEELEHHRVRTATLEVWVGYVGGFSRTGVGRLDAPSDDFFRLLEAVRQGLRRAYSQGVAVNRLHLIATRLERPGFRQPGLFDEPDEKAGVIANLKREVNAQVGRFALRSGATLPLAEIYRDGANGYDVCDIHGKTCF